MSQAASNLTFPRICTLDEYFKLAEESIEKLEFRGNSVFPLRGEVVAMAGGTEYHSLIVGNVGGELWSRIRDTSCRYYATGFRIGIRGWPTYTYSDGMVICGPTQFDDRDSTWQTALNPKLIVEVLSPSTQGYDRTQKFDRYMHIESLREYLLVSQDEPRVMVFFRQTDGTWLLSPFEELDAVVRLRSIEVELPMSEIYLNVAFSPKQDIVDQLGS